MHFFTDIFGKRKNKCNFQSVKVCDKDNERRHLGELNYYQGLDEIAKSTLHHQLSIASK